MTDDTLRLTNDDLGWIWADVSARLQLGGFPLVVPRRLEFVDSIPSDNEARTIGRWEPVTRRMSVAVVAAPYPRMVRDIVTHEIIHAIQCQFLGRHFEPGGMNGGPHEDLFVSLAGRAAGILGGMPSPVPAMAPRWPMIQRPDDYYDL